MDRSEGKEGNTDPLARMDSQNEIFKLRKRQKYEFIMNTFVYKVK
jgi:hypothetical protein